MKKVVLSFLVLFVCISSFFSCSQGGNEPTANEMFVVCAADFFGFISGSLGANEMSKLLQQQQGVNPVKPASPAVTIIAGVAGGHFASQQAAWSLPSNVRRFSNWPGEFNDTVNLVRISLRVKNDANYFDWVGVIHNNMLNDPFKRDLETNQRNLNPAIGVLYENFFNPNLTTYSTYTNEEREDFTFSFYESSRTLGYNVATRDFSNLATFNNQIDDIFKDHNEYSQSKNYLKEIASIAYSESDVNSVIARIKEYETAIIYNNNLDAKNKNLLLAASSCLRFSLGYWSTVVNH